jgi:rhodanese-related sulfurtransferase
MQKAFRKTVLHALLIVVSSAVVGIIYNAASPSGISLIGHWADADSTGFVIPLSYQEGDSLITLADAITRYQSQNTIFIDARYREDYEVGHVRGAINLSFDEFYELLPEVEPKLSQEKEMVTYCGEIDCDISLFLARLLKEKGYEKVMVMVQGWEGWVNAGLPTSKGPNP